jgi:hypothetical protein
VRKLLLRLFSLGPFVAAGLVAVVLVVVGIRLSGGQASPERPNPPIMIGPGEFRTRPPDLPPPTFNPEDFPQPKIHPVTPPPPPSHVMVNGVEIKLPPGMGYTFYGPGGVLTTANSTGSEFTYRGRPLPDRGPASSIRLDAEDRIISSRILAEHLPLFEPILEAVRPREPTNLTLSTGTVIVVPPELTLTQMMSPTGSSLKAWSITYEPIPMRPEGPSVLNIDETGRIGRNAIHPSDLHLFEPILMWLR